MIRLLIVVALAAVAWFAYTNLGKPANLDATIKNGTQSIKQEKTINTVINRRQGVDQEAADTIDNN